MFFRKRNPQVDERVEQLELEVAELNHRTEFLFSRLEAACTTLALQSEVIRELQLQALGIDPASHKKTSIN